MDLVHARRSMALESQLMAGLSAVVTGGASGIGLAISEVLSRHGARIVVADLDEAGATAAAGDLVDRGARALGIRCDVTEESDVKSVVDAAVEEFGSLDVLVNNAGITRDATLSNMELVDFRAVLDVHLQGAWLGTRHAARVMRDQKSGSIVNISSISGKVGNPGQTNYSAAKAGLVGLTKASAKELARHGVRVNAVQPGLIRTPMTQAMREDIWQRKLAEIPMGRAGDAAEVADAVLFLASDLSSYVTGAVLEVTGGRFM